MLFEVYIMNLGNYKGRYFKVGNLEELAQAEKLINPMGLNDIEIQLIDTYFPCEKINFEVLDFLRIKDNFNIDAEVLGGLFQVLTASEIEDILNKELPITIEEAHNKEVAFQQYIEGAGLLEIPPHLENYIDWSIILRDWEIRGLEIINIGCGSHLFTSKYLLVQTCY